MFQPVWTEESHQITKCLDDLAALGCDREFLQRKVQMILLWCGVDARVTPYKNQELWILRDGSSSPLWSDPLQYGNSPTRQTFTPRRIHSLKKKLHDVDYQLKQLGKTGLARNAQRGTSASPLRIDPETISLVDKIADSVSKLPNISEAESLLRQICMHVFRKTGAWRDSLIASLLGVVTSKDGKVRIPHTNSGEALKMWRIRRNVTEEKIKT